MTQVKMPKPLRLRWNKYTGRYDISEDHRAAGDADLITTTQAEAYADARVREAQQWQPIETAPKDGRQILLTNGQSVAQGWWEHEEPYIREKRDIGGFYIGQDESDGFDGWLDCEGGMQPDPTHWMPLPAPPHQ